ncbi:carboxymuconolactone decarboxylase family protein [Salinadaptatus halalkaliphilus]|uniref:Carboxymuconolactone decarboxylase family protein n=1 Tax=Salinadaptatus halalkaliphilus TaxID=2419781 RepID=A0A4S3TIJ7_9EURY|nr:carboxymuconolactone decarboxylase family protein [Salinadaptatus halalkaliphilus]THE63360.1 carboxymuconolactone decarboxylase family protein [Salinadaptatus halalkaliphilus]
MVSEDTRTELEEMLGQVPSWIEPIPDEAADHAWGMVRDLQFGETTLSQREKALVGLGAATAIQCPYCTHFHTAEAEMEGVSETGLSEAIGIASDVQYFSSVLHGAQVEYDEFVEETADIVEHVENQQAAAPSDD